MANELYNVVISKQARQMLVSCAAFLAKVSVPAAERLVSSFEEAANSLKQMPQRCPWLTNDFIPRNTYRYLVFEKRYLMIYQTKDNTVFVDYIVDCRQDYGWLLK